MNQVSVRAIREQEMDTVARMHEEMLYDEFIVRFGLRFLRRYYRAFSDSPYAVALVAVDNTTNEILGALLGTLNPSLHYRYLTRRHGILLAGNIFIQSITHFGLARDLIRTRVKRYMLGVLRTLKRGEEKPVEDGSNQILVGDITHLFVDQTRRAKGVGTSLVRAYQDMAVRAGVQRIDLVTAPTELGGAGPFYEKLGWTRTGQHVSQSGEEFLFYRLHVTEPVDES